MNITPDKLWYSQHFIAYRQLFTHATTQAVLEFIVDEFMRKSKVNEESIRYVSFSKNDITVKTNLCWRSVDKALHILDETGIIELSSDNENECFFNEALFISLVCSVASLKTSKEKKSFAEALEAGDWNTLEGLGYELHKEYRDILRKVSGSPLESCDKSQNPMTKVTTLCKKSEDCDKSHNVMTNVTTLLKKSEPYDICHNFPSICNRATNYFADEIRKNCEKDELIALVSHDFAPIFTTWEEFERFIDDFYSGEELLYSPLVLCLLQVVTFCIGGYDKSHNGVMIKVNHYIKENKEELKNEGDPEGPYNKGEDKDEIEKVDEGLIGDEIPRFNINEDLYKLAKKKAKLPYFNSQEVTEIINNIEVAIQREDKLFIHQLWEELSIYCTEEVDGDEIPRKIEGYEIFADQLHCILEPAFETTNEIIQQGYVSFNGEEIPVSIKKELDPEAVDLIIDWEKIKTEENTFVKVSQARLKNIYGEEVEAVRKKGRRRTDEDRERINNYYRQFILAGNDQEKLDGLSDIECAIFDFIDQFFKVDWEGGEITGLGDNFQERNFLTASEFNQFIFQVSDKYGITREDFLSVVNEKPDLDGNLTVSERMLNVDGIQAWNKKHSQESSIKI